MGRPKKVVEAEPEKKEVEVVVNKNLVNLMKEFKQKGFPVKMGSEVKQEPKIRTGVYALDYVMDGGIAQSEGGHFIEFSGAESSGKTTFASKVIARFQELGKNCAMIDGEQSFSPEWAGVMGVDIENLLVIQPEHLEQTGDMLVELIQKGFDLIVVDSVASLIPMEELEASMEDKHMASQAKVNSPLCRKLLAASAGKIVCIIFINQMREKVGIAYGNPEITPGGKALKHTYHTMIKFKRGEFIEEGTKEDKVKNGFTCVLTNIKNKKGKPHRNAAVDFYFDGNVDNNKTLLYSAIKCGIIKQGGAWFEYNGEKYQGEKQAISCIEDKDWVEIEKQIWERTK